MSRIPADLSPGSAVVEINAEQDTSPSAFRQLFAVVYAGSEPRVESIDAALALRTIRADTDA